MSTLILFFYLGYFCWNKKSEEDANTADIANDNFVYV